MVNKRLEKLYTENLKLTQVRNMLVRDLENVNVTLDKFLNCFGDALLKKQFEIERLKNKINDTNLELCECGNQIEPKFHTKLCETCYRKKDLNPEKSDPINEPLRKVWDNPDDEHWNDIKPEQDAPKEESNGNK